MNGHVFQCPNEGGLKNEFKKTVEALHEYISKKITYPGDMWNLTMELKEPEVVAPDSTMTEVELASADPFKKAVWAKQVINYVTRTEQLEHNKRAVFAVIMGQCSDAMKAKVRAHADFRAKNSKGDCVWLLTTIRATMLKFETHQYLVVALRDAHAAISSHRQGDNDLTTYRNELENLVEAYEEYGGSYGRSRELMDKIEGWEGSSNLTNKEKSQKAHDRSVAVQFLYGADKRQYGTLWVNLQNNFAMNLKQYPADLTAAYQMLLNHVPPRGHETPRTPKGNSPNTTNSAVPSSIASTTSELTGVSFAQAGTTVPGSDGTTHEHITCFNCNSKGHYASVCPATTGTTNLHTTVEAAVEGTNDNDNDGDDDTDEDEAEEEDAFYGCTFATSDATGIPDSWILLDSQSTVSIFRNPRFLRNIRESPTKLVVDTNGGKQISTMVGDLKNFGPVWYNPESIANILSHADVAKKYRITSDSAIERAFHVHRNDGTLMTFTESPSGLYFFDAVTAVNDRTNQKVADYSFVITVVGNKQRFHRREFEGAERARKLCRQLGHPSEAHFARILSNNLIRNCPVTVDDAKRAVMIYGPDIASLKGKSVKGPAQHVPTFAPIHVPDVIIKDHKDVTICMDFFWVQGNPFFHTVCRKIKFRTVSPVKTTQSSKKPKANKEIILKETKFVVDLYRARGFNVVAIHADMDFECIRADMKEIHFEITANDPSEQSRNVCALTSTTCRTSGCQN